MMKIKQNAHEKLVENMSVLSLSITIMASLLLIFVFLGATSYLYMQSPSTVAYSQESANDFGHELKASFLHESTQKEWKWLYRYHGNPSVVVYEEWKTPYFFDKQGQKCAFINPSKRIGLIKDQANNSDYYAELKLSH